MVFPQTGSVILELIYTGNENRKRELWLVILGFLTWKITSTSQQDAILCRFRKNNTLGSAEPARIVGDQLFRSVSVKGPIEYLT